ncbi:MAG: DUF3179 domain-containing protein [Anaerolineaceae bacterium]|nr:DUF3179 domain-containing protein [Anaerolineaceae bacterium]MDE0327897.1 DUF3179 domain-containing protein [Anaerolineaceae bacterium]
MNITPGLRRRHALTLLALAIFAAALALQGAPMSGQSGCAAPAFVRFTSFWDTTDFCMHTVPLEEIFSGGVPPDGIPPIDDPAFDSLEVAAQWLQPQSPVLSLELNDTARAYPLAILTRHEIVNDVFDDQPVAVTFCPLCNSAVVFDRRVDGETLRFGVSGNLRHSDLVMWDDLTKSWWQQFTGEGIVGSYAGTQLELLPSLLVSFGEFAQQYPQGEVLSPGFRGYGSNPYVGYDSSPRPFLFFGEPDGRLFATERVLGAFLGGEAVAWPFPALKEAPVINDRIGDFEVVALWQPGQTSALDASDINSSRDVGMAALYDRELEGQVLSFALDDEGRIVDEQTGTRWNVFGTALEGELAGSQLRQHLAFPHFWFAWAAFRPETRVYGLSE